MYKKLSKLNQESVNNLIELYDEVQFINKNIRTGASGIEKMSVYFYSKWKTWNRHQTSKFKNCFSQTLVDNSLIGWFLKFPSNKGFLDLMTTWVGKDCGTVYAYALEDNQKIWLNGIEITVNKGEGIEFCLSIPHEVKLSSLEQKWACLMSL